MLERLSASWELTKASLGVLRADKELMLFPLLSFVGLVLSMAVFFAPLAVFGVPTASGQAFEIVGFSIGLAYWFVASAITIFFNAALVGAALIRLDGGDPTLSDGLRIAWSRLGSILRWALVAASVGMLLKMARERGGGIARFVASVVGVAWNLATFLVVPVLVTREIGPIDALKESGGLLRRTWGEQIVGNLGIGLVTGVAMFGWAFLGIGGAVLVGQLGIGPLFAAVVAVVMLGFALLTLAHVSLSGIYSAALYRYATTGEVRGVDRRLLENAFRAK